MRALFLESASASSVALQLTLIRDLRPTTISIHSLMDRHEIRSQIRPGAIRSCSDAKGCVSSSRTFPRLRGVSQCRRIHATSFAINGSFTPRPQVLKDLKERRHFIGEAVQSSALVDAPGCMIFFTAIAYTFCLELPATWSIDFCRSLLTHLG